MRSLSQGPLLCFGRRQRCGNSSLWVLCSKGGSYMVELGKCVTRPPSQLLHGSLLRSDVLVCDVQMTQALATEGARFLRLVCKLGATKVLGMPVCIAFVVFFVTFCFISVRFSFAIAHSHTTATAGYNEHSCYFQHPRNHPFVAPMGLKQLSVCS